MSKHMKCNPHGMQRQRGAVALIVAICLVLLVGMLGLVLDLGHLYVTRTELQNAADSSSLSGARELNGRVTGINNAITRAIEAAGKNKFNLNSTVVTVNASNMWVGSCPADGCMVPISSVTTDALAGDKTFLKVDTGLRTINTWFIQALPGVASTTQTFGMAVAGKYAVDITPIAICEQPDPGTINELGFERGVSYNVQYANPLGPGTLFWIDPESNVPGVCPVISTNATLPYVCTGKVGFTPIIGDTVNTNTGVSVPQLAALNSRFGDYTPQNKCDVATAPPDTNIKEYIYGNAAGTGSPKDWMGKDPIQQSITFVQRSNVNNLCGPPSQPCRPKPYSLRSGAGTDYGVLWAGFRRAGATVAQWPTLYPGNTATSYPEPSPYAQASGSFFTAPAVSIQPGKAGRRVLNMVIIDCTTAGGVCRQATVLGVGRFLMQTRSVPTAKDVFVEFGGLLPTPLPTSDIKLYR